MLEGAVPCSLLLLVYNFQGRSSGSMNSKNQNTKAYNDIK